MNRRDEKNHNFISHYQLGGRQPAEDKPLQKTFFDQNLQRYCIDFAEHNTHYNFHDSRELVSDFLIAFVCTAGFKCTITIANQQPPPEVGFVELTNSRIWQTSVNEGVYFNHFIKTNLAEDILKRVIVNGMTGSSWHFKRFDRLCLTVNSDQMREIGK